jgi:hypothetical protein
MESTYYNLLAPILKSSPSCLSMERPKHIGITRLYMSTSTWILCCKKTILRDPLRSIDRQDGEDFKICVSGHFQIWAAVVKCIETRPPVYLVKDDHGEILEGTFYVESSFHKSHKTIDCPCHSVPFARLTLQVGVVCFCRSCLRIQLLKDSGYPRHLIKY